MELREATGQVDVRTYLRVLRRRKVTIGLVTLVIVGLALAYSLIKTPIYTATAQVLVPEQSAAAALQPTAGQQDPAASTAQRTLTDAQQFAKGGQTKAAATAILHRRPLVSVSASTTADVLSFTASSTNKLEVSTTVNSYAQAYINANRANEVSQYAGQVEALQASIAKLQRTASSQPAGSEQRAAAASSITSLTQALQQLQATSELVAQTGPSIIDAATPPTSPSSPKPLRNGVLALIAGLILGVGLAFVRDRLDDKVKSLTDVEESSGGLPIVGMIPMVDSWKQAPLPHVAFWEAADSSASEAYRTLRTSIQFLGIEQNQQVIGITSATPDEGKSTAAANLAVSFARAGQRVVVVSCDLRRPRLHLFFGLDNHTGATSVLLGQSTLAEALCHVPSEPNLRVLTSGPVPPNPAEILSLDRVRQLIDVLTAHADVVLLDCPPVLPVTDSLLISRLCDSMLVIAVAAVTKKGDLRRTYELLSQVQAPVRGTILNRVPQRDIYAAGYGYGYGYGYKTTDGTPSVAIPTRQSDRTDLYQGANTESPSSGHESDSKTFESAASTSAPGNGQQSHSSTAAARANGIDRPSEDEVLVRDRPDAFPDLLEHPESPPASEDLGLPAYEN